VNPSRDLPIHFFITGEQEPRAAGDYHFEKALAEILPAWSVSRESVRCSLSEKKRIIFARRVLRKMERRIAPASEQLSARPIDERCRFCVHLGSGRTKAACIAMRNMLRHQPKYAVTSYACGRMIDYFMFRKLSCVWLGKTAVFVRFRGRPHAV